MGFALSEMQLTSSSFPAKGEIPAQYTGVGEDISPALAWDKVPAGAQSFAILCHDPDAPKISPDGHYGFVHWVLYNIPADVSSIPEAVEGFSSGKNDFGNSGYGGPMPPEGHGPHHYFFMVLALDTPPELPEGLDFYQLLAKVEPNVLGMNRLVGTFNRP